MFHHFLVRTAFILSRWLPRTQRLKFQIVLVIFVVLTLTPQFYILTRRLYVHRPRSSRYCQKPLLGNLTVCIVFSFMATGLAVTLTLTDPVPQSVLAAYHAFGLLSFTQGLCTTVLTLSATSCAKTTPELYYFSLVLSWACIIATAFFLVRGGLWLIHRLCPNWNLEKCLCRGT